MMEELYRREMYGPVLSVKIESMGATAVAIANRWALGWPERVAAMVKEQSLLTHLRPQLETEKTVLSEVVGMSHLSNAEILAMNEIPPGPPGTSA